jgi:hypothetical protein
MAMLDVMKLLKKSFILSGSFFIALIFIYRAMNSSEIGFVIFSIIMAIFFLSFSVFLLLENQIKSTSLYRHIDRNYLSAEISFKNQPWNLSLLAFQTFASYILIALFAWGIIDDNLPYKEIPAARYIIYAFFILFVAAACYLTYLLVNIIRQARKMKT